MSGRYKISDFRDALQINSVENRPLLKAAFNGVTTGSVSAMFVNQHLGRVNTVVVSSLFGALGMVRSLRAAKAEMRVTNNEFQMRGTYGPAHQTLRTANSADVRGFAYLKRSMEGAEFPDYPGGLYALVGSRHVCLLPYVTSKDVWPIVDRIKLRFPHLSWLTVDEIE